MESALYTGTLEHRRYLPQRHSFRYSLFMPLLDIDRIPQLMRISPFCSYNSWNWASFHERDHFGDPRRPLRARLEEDAHRHGLELPDGPVYLLTHLRYLGYVFNPVSFFYCCGPGGSPALLLAEVNNTFGEAQNHWLSAENALPGANSRRYRSAKLFHVSPFMPMGLEYVFTFTDPGEDLVAHMRVLEDGRTFFDASLRLRRKPWSARSLHSALLRRPWMTAKVIGAIHWEALRLWLKNVPLYTHPGRIRGPHSEARGGGGGQA
jgi:DUF1365 family protein